MRRVSLVMAVAALLIGCTSRVNGSASTGSVTSGGSSSGSTGGTGSGSGSTGSTTGSLDAGCHHPGHVAELGACVLDADCLCPLSCVADPQGQRLCEAGCEENSDCPGGEFCDAGSCVVELGCNSLGGVGELARCEAVSDCLCPLSCFDDGTLGNVCERPCRSELDCLDAGTFCESDAGSCQYANGCNPGLNAAGEFGSCRRDQDCRCPFECVDDQARGFACERSCVSDADCGDAGETCALKGDGGECELACTPGLPSAFAPCLGTFQCPCPMACQLVLNGDTMLCLDCDGGNCAPPPGECIDAGPEAAASQSPIQSYPGAVYDVRCSSNADCYCPNECLPFDYVGTVTFICQPGGNPCASLADCSDPAEACLFGRCLPNDCPSYANLGDSCDPSGGENPALRGSGACLYSAHGLNLVCTQGGDAGAGCSTHPDRHAPQSLCPAGSVCFGGDAGSFCAPACSGGLSACDAGNCASGVCLPGNTQCTDDLPTYLPDDGPFDGASSGVEWAPCYDLGLCRCPLACVRDPAFPFGNLEVYDCERACQSAADCPLPMSSCTGGLCAFNAGVCALGEGDGGIALGAACDAGDGPGTCVYFAPFSVRGQGEVEPTAVCRADGPARAQCDPQASRGGAALCGAGTDCLPLGDGGFGCLALCNPLLAGSCPAGEGCFPRTNNSGFFNEGSCAPLGDSGCSLALPSNDLAPCQGASDCACGLACVPVEAFESVCMLPCSKVTDCAVDEVCFGEASKRFCQLNRCALGGTVCDADVGADGTCHEVTSIEQPYALPRAAEGDQAPFDICEQAGTATRNCDPAADRTALNLHCVPGSVCDTTGAVPTCTPLCVRLADAGQTSTPPCGPGKYCVPLPIYASQIPRTGRIEGECLPARGVDAG